MELERWVEHETGESACSAIEVHVDMYMCTRRHVYVYT